MFTEDIWGEPWQPCEACPRKDKEVCPSRRHRALCQDVEGLKAFIVSQPPELREPVKRNVVPAPPRCDESAPQPPTPARINIRETSLLVKSCDYRGPIVEPGCNCKRVCGMGHGYKPEGQPFGIVVLNDCWRCVTSGDSHVQEHHRRT